jgi:hypothetical protein
MLLLDDHLEAALGHQQRCGENKRLVLAAQQFLQVSPCENVQLLDHAAQF